MTDSDQEEPITDVIEQNEPAVPGAQEGSEAQIPGRIPLEADEADAAEQAREVQLDDDDYR
ncbi:MAG TPA: hypothetical protein VMA95_15480 [Streptosporangiaceae bacterium]|nr:hypothetical protein [Streptosporangiaceae bacterium]